MILFAFKYKTPAPGFRWAFFTISLFLFLPFFAVAQSAAFPLLWGTNSGLYSRNQAGRVEALWSGGSVQKIVHIPGTQRQAETWAILTDQGILVSNDLRSWEIRNRGLPERLIKVYENGKKTFISTVQDIKAFSVDPQNGETMVIAVKNEVYLSKNGARSWESLGMPNFRSNGIKAVAVTSFGSELTVFCAHSIYGVYYINPQTPGAKWTEISNGLEKLETTNNPDEISSFAVSLDSGSPTVYASMSFRRRLYKLDWNQKNWNQIWSDGAAFGPVDSLALKGNSLFFLQDGAVAEFELSSGRLNWRQDTTSLIKAIPGYRPNCAAVQGFRENARGREGTICFSELWLLDKNRISGRGSLAAGKEGLYLPVNHAMDPSSLRPYLNIIRERRLNMVVIDMKDDYGTGYSTPVESSDFEELDMDDGDLPF